MSSFVDLAASVPGYRGLCINCGKRILTGEPVKRVGDRYVHVVCPTAPKPSLFERIAFWRDADMQATPPDERFSVETARHGPVEIVLSYAGRNNATPLLRWMCTEARRRELQKRYGLRDVQTKLFTCIEMEVDLTDKALYLSNFFASVIGGPGSCPGMPSPLISGVAGKVGMDIVDSVARLGAKAGLLNKITLLDSWRGREGYTSEDIKAAAAPGSAACHGYYGRFGFTSNPDGYCSKPVASASAISI